MEHYNISKLLNNSTESNFVKKMVEINDSQVANFLLTKI